MGKGVIGSGLASAKKWRLSLFRARRPYLDKVLQQLPVSTVGIFDDLPRLCDVGFQDLDVLGTRTVMQMQQQPRQQQSAPTMESKSAKPKPSVGIVGRHLILDLVFLANVSNV